MENEKEINEWKQKADKWDALEKEIAAFYVDEDGNGGLVGIGEAAAMAFGFL